MKRYTSPNCDIIDVELESNFVYSGGGHCLCFRCKCVKCPYGRD